jgi:hypothetical protein
MALGDYTKTAYVSGTTPAINATNLNNNENKTKEIDTAMPTLQTSVSANATAISTLQTDTIILKRKLYMGVI